MDLEQERFDRLCDQLFHGDESDWVEESFMEDSAANVGPSLRDGHSDSLSSRETAGVRASSVAQVSSTLPSSRTKQAASRPIAKTSRSVGRRNSSVRSWLGTSALLLCALFSAFCFYKHGTEEAIRTKPIEDVHPPEKVIVDAPAEALATDFARLDGRAVEWDGADGSLEVDGVVDPLRELTGATPEAIRRADYRLLILQAIELWPDGTVNEINVETLQPWQWIHEHQVHVGGHAALPLDTVEMGLPEGMTGRVLDILPCPKIKSGPGRIVLTTVNRLARGVIELTLRDSRGHSETLRPTGEHLFYSMTQGEWLPGAELQPGEHLDGLHGTITVTAVTPLSGTHRVYNMTVEGEHLYRVGACGVLVHNNYAPKAGDFGLKSIIGKANMTTGQAGRYFGWGRGSSLTKNAGNFTREQLVKDGFTKEVLEEMAGAYEGIAKTLSRSDLVNHAAPARAKQIRDILEALFQ